MSIEKVRDYFRPLGREQDILEFPVSSATGEDGVEPPEGYIQIGPDPLRIGEGAHPAPRFSSYPSFPVACFSIFSAKMA